MTILLALLYPIAIQYERGGLWHLLAPLTVATLLADVVANYTEMALLFGWPRAGEYTFSSRLARMEQESPPGDPVHKLIAIINQISPTGRHIQ